MGKYAKFMKSVILDPEEAEDFEETVGSKSLQVTRCAEIIHRWQPEPETWSDSVIENNDGIGN